MTKVGNDISHWQDPVDLVAAKSAIDFIIFKATEGTTYLDITFTARWRKAADLGLPRIAYHFARPDDSGPAAQADFFVSKVKTAGTSGKWAVALDFEAPSKQSPSALWSWATTWIERVRAGLGRPVLFYTYPSYWSDVMARPKGGSCPANALLWWAQYNDSPSSAPFTPAVWQCGDGTHGCIVNVPGIGKVDYNRMTDTAYKELFGGSMASMDDVIRVAESQVGVNEDPPGSNHVPYTEWYGIGNVAWCAIFQSWAFAKAGNPLPPIETAKGFHYTPNGARWFQDHGRWTTKPARGHLVFYDFPDASNRIQHVGLVTGVNADGTINTIEGNTSQSSQDDGGEVQKRTRPTSSVVGYGIPIYGEEDMSAADVEAINKHTDEVLGQLRKDLTVTGTTGLEQTMELLYQRAKGADLDADKIKADVALLLGSLPTAEAIATAVRAKFPEGIGFTAGDVAAEIIRQLGQTPS